VNESERGRGREIEREREKGQRPAAKLGQEMCLLRR